MQIVYCGGIDGDVTIANCAEYDPATDTWDATAVPPMAVGRNHAASCTDGTDFFVFGGRSGPNIVGEGFGETQIFRGGAWSLGTPIPFARGGMGKAVFHQGQCFVFGGETWPQQDAPAPALGVDADRTVFTVDIYDIANDSWSRGAVRLPPRCVSSSCCCWFLLCCPRSASTPTGRCSRSTFMTLRTTAGAAARCALPCCVALLCCCFPLRCACCSRSRAAGAWPPAVRGAFRQRPQRLTPSNLTTKGFDQKQASVGP